MVRAPRFSFIDQDATVLPPAASTGVAPSATTARAAAVIDPVRRARAVREGMSETVSPIRPIRTKHVRNVPAMGRPIGQRKRPPEAGGRFPRRKASWKRTEKRTEKRTAKRRAKPEPAGR